MVAAADQPDREPGPGTDPSVLAERRARRAELAEGELRARLADAERRVAQLEHGAHEAERLRERLAARAERDGRMAALVADAAATLRAAREALDREIAARGVVEAALHAERAAREAAEQAVVAERAARDAATSALTAERARVTPAPSPPPLPVVPAALVPEEPPAAPDNESLIAGLALAAERLRAQAEAGSVPAGADPEARGEPAPDVAGGDPENRADRQPEPVATDVAVDDPENRADRQPEPAATDAPAATQAVADPPAQEPWAPRPGGLVERLGRLLTRRI